MICLLKLIRILLQKTCALLVDMMRGLMYRDFGIKHPTQKLSDKMVNVRVNKDGAQSAKLTTRVMITDTRD